MRPISLQLLLLLAMSACSSPADEGGDGGSPEFTRNVRLGMNTSTAAFHPYMPEAIRLASAQGVGWIRLSCGWQRIEPADDAWSFASCDSLVQHVRAQDMQVVFQFNTANQWCTSAPATETGLADREMYPPCDYDQYSEFVYRVVSRYGARSNSLGGDYGRNQVMHWEVWNEPDLRFYWRMPPPRPQSDAPAEYAKLLDIAHDAIKSADPAASVLLGGLALGGGTVDPQFFDKIMADPQHPASSNFDIANFHTYASKTNAAAQLRAVKARADNRPVWITEIGFPSDPELQRKYSHYTQYPAGEAGQAAYLTDVIPHLLANGADKVFWYTLVDPVRDVTNFCAHGVLYISGYQCSDRSDVPVTAALSRKQAYGAIAQIR